MQLHSNVDLYRRYGHQIPITAKQLPEQRLPTYQALLTEREADDPPWREIWSVCVWSDRPLNSSYCHFLFRTEQGCSSETPPQRLWYSENQQAILNPEVNVTWYCEKQLAILNVSVRRGLTQSCTVLWTTWKHELQPAIWISNRNRCQTSGATVPNFTKTGTFMRYMDFRSYISWADAPKGPVSVNRWTEFPIPP